MHKKLFLFLWSAFSLFSASAQGVMSRGEDGSQLWLRQSSTQRAVVTCENHSSVLDIARSELETTWQGGPVRLVCCSLKRWKQYYTKHPAVMPMKQEDGYVIEYSAKEEPHAVTITAPTDKGLLYGAYALLRQQVLDKAEGKQASGVLQSEPAYALRVLNHWDNLDGTVERGWAGYSIFWRDEKTPTVTEADKARWRAYARANASIGINGTVVNNVNASPEMLSAPVLAKVRAIADVLRPYGLKVYLAVNFSSPAQLGGLKDSDPLNPEVAQWWKAKVAEIYAAIPDFGGFLVKANSEGLPGPQDYGRTHADGANLLADVLAPYKGIVMWRAFVYNATETDRAKQAYAEFMPFNGKFRNNVIIQIKNGPVDFQPREPFSALFGALDRTQTMCEVQITQEYLGASTHLVFLAPMWEECLKSDTYQHGKGSLVGKEISAFAGVANIGLDTNWCGHDFAQANWYAFGRQAWNPMLPSDSIAREWLIQTFANSKGTASVEAETFLKKFVTPWTEEMCQSREAAVSYMMPLGLHHIFAGSHHYGPEPWYAPKGLRKDWTPPYYHKADKEGIGFERSRLGSDAVSQYAEPLRSLYDDLSTCPEAYLLWFHHVPWTYPMKNGHSLWSNLCMKYATGYEAVQKIAHTWDATKSVVDDARFERVQQRLVIQQHDALWWKDACLLYFQEFNQLPFPAEMPYKPTLRLKDLKGVQLHWDAHN